MEQIKNFSRVAIFVEWGDKYFFKNGRHINHEVKLTDAYFDCPLLDEDDWNLLVFKKYLRDYCQLKSLELEFTPRPDGSSDRIISGGMEYILIKDPNLPF